MRLKSVAEQGQQPLRAGKSYDANNKFVGSYIYLQGGEEDQKLLDQFCTCWLETYKRNPEFFLTIDLETGGLNPVIPEIPMLLQAISWNGRQALVFEHHKFDCTLYKKVLNTIPLANHNLKFDAKFWIQKFGVRPKLFWCTMIAAQLGWAGAFPGYGALFNLGNVITNVLVDFKILKDVRSEFIGKQPLSGFTREQVEYAARDALLTYRLVGPQKRRLINQKLLEIFVSVEMRLMEILTYTELQGIDVDVEMLNEFYDEKENRMYDLDKEIQKYILESIPDSDRPPLPKSDKTGKYNVGSPIQLPELLAAIGIQIPNTTKDTLFAAKGQHNLPFLDNVVEYRQLKTDISKQAKAWREEFIYPVTKKIYPVFYVHGAGTGRLSCGDPPIHQTTPVMRPMLVAPPGWKCVGNDYSQYEFRGCAAYTREQALVDAYEERAELLPKVELLAHAHGYIDADGFCKDVTKGKIKLQGSDLDLVQQFNFTDIHRRNASLVFGVPVSDITDTQRSVGKTMGYALLYGSMAANIQVQLAKSDIHYRLDECQMFYTTYFENVPRIKKFILDVHAQVRDGGWIENWVGRKRFFKLPPKFQASRYKKDLMDAQREAVNWFFQCTNAHATKMSMIELADAWEREYEESERPFHIINMHDELVAVAPDAHAERVAVQQKEVMVRQGALALRNLVPMECSGSIDTRWTK